MQLQIDIDLHELEIFKKELAVVWSRYYTDNWLEELKQKNEYFSHFSQWPDRDSSRTLPSASYYVTTSWNWSLKFGNERHVIAFANDSRLELNDVRQKKQEA